MDNKKEQQVFINKLAIIVPCSLLILTCILRIYLNISFPDEIVGDIIFGGFFFIMYVAIFIMGMIMSFILSIMMIFIVREKDSKKYIPFILTIISFILSILVIFNFKLW